MIPVGVGKQKREVERLVFELFLERPAKQPQAGAGIENDDFIAGAELEARRVAPEMNRARSGEGIEPRTPQNLSCTGESLPVAWASLRRTSSDVPVPSRSSTEMSTCGWMGLVRYSSAPASRAEARSASKSRPEVTTILVCRSVMSPRIARQT